MDKSASPGVEDGVSPEALRNLRVPFVRRITVLGRGGGEDLFAMDLGLRGVFVERAEPFPAGQAVEVRFLLPGNDIPFSAVCRMAWWHPPGAPLVSKALPGGVGLEFVEVSSWDQGRLREFLLDHLRRDPARRRFQRHWPVPGEEDQPQ